MEMAADANKQANKIALADTKPFEPPRRLVEEGESIFTTIPLDEVETTTLLESRHRAA